MIQWGCGDFADHKWGVFSTPEGLYNILNYNSELCLAIEGGSLNQGAKAIQWPCGNFADHKWYYWGGSVGR
ncbi:hypothetical protein GCM10027569_82380 [Flindersiella endophytica]